MKVLEKLQQGSVRQAEIRRGKAMFGRLVCRKTKEGGNKQKT